MEDPKPPAGKPPDEEFLDRLATLRAARGLTGTDDDRLLDAALIELDHAAEELRTAKDEIGVRGGELADDRISRDRERGLLRYLFQQLPVPVLLLARDGMIRRANQAAAALLGVSAGYATGRPFPIFVDLPSRAAFRSHLAASCRHGEERRLALRITGTQAGADTRVILKPLALPGEAANAVILLILPAGPGQPAAPVEPTASARPHRSQPPRPGQPAPARADSGASAVQTRRTVHAVDVLDRMTRTLLDDECATEPVALMRGARLLRNEFADYVVVDMLRGGQLARVVVAAADDAESQAAARQLERTDPAAAPMISDVIQAGRVRVHAHLDDLGGLTDDWARPLLARLSIRSVVCVPLRTGDGTLGAVTLLRGHGLPPFGLAEAGLLEKLCAHLALAVRMDRRYRRRTTAASLHQPGLQPGRLTRVRGLDFAAVCRGGQQDAGGGTNFYEVFPTSDGYGLALGKVAGEGEDAVAVAGLVRHAMRLFGLEESGPAQVLSRVNRALLAQRHVDRLVTAALATVSWEGSRLRVRLGGAGHPAPVTVRPGGWVRPTLGGGSPLGRSEDPQWGADELELDPGDTLLLYSEGAVAGAGGAPGGTELYGEDRLVAALAVQADLGVEAMVNRLEADILDFAGGEPQDDICLLALRVGHPEEDD